MQNQKQLIIGVIHLYGFGLGDNVMVLESLFALKKIYNCKLIVFGVSAILGEMLKHVTYVDEFIESGWFGAECLEYVNKYHYDYIILTKFKTYFIPYLWNLQTKHIITARQFSSFILPLRTVAMKNMNVREHILAMVRRVKRNYYDKKIADIDFKHARIVINEEYKQKIDSFLQNKVEISTKLIMVVPFNIKSLHKLSMDAYIDVMLRIACITHCVVVVVTYPEVHESFMNSLQSYKNTYKSFSNQDSLHSNNKTLLPPDILIFQNNDDIMNLVALISRCNLVIAPSTGSIHLATHLGIPTIGYYEPSECKKWGGHTKDSHYVFLHNPYHLMTKSQENLAITQTLDMLKNILNINDENMINTDS